MPQHSGGHGDLDAALAGYGRLLARAAPSLREDPYDRLCGAVALVREILASAGPRLAQDAVWLAQREEYLADAAARLTDGVLRLQVALASPAESDLSIRVSALRENIAYFADVTADIVPAPVYLDVGRDLLPTIEEKYAAPGLSLQLLPLVERVLRRMRTACGFAAALTARADALLARPVPGGAVSVPARSSLDAVHRGEIDSLISGLRGSRPALLARQREDERTHARAIRECLDLTPRQLYSMLARYTVAAGGEADDAN